MVALKIRKLLSAVLWFNYATGYFPVPLREFQEESSVSKFRLQLPNLLAAIALCSLSLIGNVDFVLNSLHLSTASTSDKIISVGWAVAYYIGDGFIRFFALIHTKKVWTIVTTCDKIRGSTIAGGQNACPMRKRLETRVLKSLCFNWFLLGLYLVARLVGPIYLPVPPFPVFSFLSSDQVTLQRFFMGISEATATTSAFVSYSTPLLVGLLLSQVLSDVSEEYKSACVSLLMSKDTGSYNRDEMHILSDSTRWKLKQILDKFILLREAHTEANKAFSGILLLAFGIPAFTIMNQIFQLIISTDEIAFPPSFVMSIVYYFHSLLLLCYVGSYLQKKNKKNQSHLRETLAFLELNNNTTSLFQRISIEAQLGGKDKFDLVKFWNEDVFDWDWKFTSYHAFEVDMGLLSQVASFAMGYLVFIFQMKVSGN